MGSHAEGIGTLASGTSHMLKVLYHSFWNGIPCGWIILLHASLDYQTVVGQYNVGTYPNGNDTFVVGTGVSCILVILAKMHLK
jgi:hypothetical protein